MLERHEIRIVTVSRQAGAGGAHLAQALAARLGWPTVDRTLLEEVARRLQAPLEEVEGADEYVGGLLTRTWKALARGTPDFLIAPLGAEPEAVARAEREVIQQVAESPPVIVVGRGAQCLLHQRPDALHVRMVAPWKVRAARLAEARGLSLEQAWEEARKIDEERDRYVQKHFHCRREEPSLYDLQLNTGGLTLDEAVEIVLGLIRRRQAPESAVRGG
jgi:CMP/dCMP kinase